MGATHLIVVSPLWPLLFWASHQPNLETLPLFADSFAERTSWTRVRNAMLASVLNHPSFKVVANHQIAAALDLWRIGVDGDKIVPWDYPRDFGPDAFPPKSLNPDPSAPLRLVFVGSQIESKGPGDLVDAVDRANRAGLNVRLSLAGRPQDWLTEKVRRLGLGGEVQFLGTLPHSEVALVMNQHDAVVVPSDTSFRRAFQTRSWRRSSRARR
ncbi:MAG: glycosyltransferase family 4 protein [Myxococcales bacterium]|nr:glycosyltransferase family 4 protein [Myxococcales bacterium]